jgi:hypothetical protein
MGLLENLQAMLPWRAERDRGLQDAPLRAFGKLPIYEDFLPPIGAEGAGDWFRKWILEGRQANDNYAGSLSSRARLLLSPPNHPDAVVGSIVASRDGARPPRKFPFSVYILVPKATLLKAVPAVTHWTWGIWDALDTALEGLQSVPSVEAYRGFCNNRVIPLPPPLDQAQREAHTSEWRGRDTVQWLQAVLGQNFRSVAPRFLRRAKRLFMAADPGPVAVRVPLGRSPAAPVQMDFWVDAATRVQGKKAGIPTVLLMKDMVGENAAFVLLSRTTEQRDFLFLGPRESYAQFVEDLTCLSPDGKEEKGFDLDNWLASHRSLEAVQDFFVGDEEK